MVKKQDSWNLIVPSNSIIKDDKERAFLAKLMREQALETISVMSPAMLDSCLAGKRFVPTIILASDLGMEQAAQAINAWQKTIPYWKNKGVVQQFYVLKPDPEENFELTLFDLDQIAA